MWKSFGYSVGVQWDIIRGIKFGLVPDIKVEYSNCVVPIPF